MDSLAVLVRLAYGLDPLEEGTLFLFCGLKKDRLKGLVFEGITSAKHSTHFQCKYLCVGNALEIYKNVHD